MAARGKCFVVAAALAALSAGCMQDTTDPIRRALAFLESKQRPTGELSTYVIATLNAPVGVHAPAYHPSPFITTFVLHALARAGVSGALVQRARAFVAAQR